MHLILPTGRSTWTCTSTHSATLRELTCQMHILQGMCVLKMCVHMIGPDLPIYFDIHDHVQQRCVDCISSRSCLFRKCVFIAFARNNTSHGILSYLHTHSKSEGRSCAIRSLSSYACIGRVYTSTSSTSHNIFHSCRQPQTL